MIKMSDGWFEEVGEFEDAQCGMEDGSIGNFRLFTGDPNSNLNLLNVMITRGKTIDEAIALLSDPTRKYKLEETENGVMML